MTFFTAALLIGAATVGAQPKDVEAQLGVHSRILSEVRQVQRSVNAQDESMDQLLEHINIVARSLGDTQRGIIESFNRAWLKLSAEHEALKEERDVLGDEVVTQARQITALIHASDGQEEELLKLRAELAESRRRHQKLWDWATKRWRYAKKCSLW